MTQITSATVDVGANGQWKAAQGTITADKPAWNSTATWNSGGTTFTHLKANVTDTASAAASLLIDLQVGGASKFSVTKGGVLTATTLAGTLSTAAQPNVTSLGTLTSLTVSGAITSSMAGAGLRINLGVSSDLSGADQIIGLRVNGDSRFSIGTSGLNMMIGVPSDIPSTSGWSFGTISAADGSTYAEVAKIDRTGIATFAAGLNVSAGTTAVQALTALNVIATNTAATTYALKGIGRDSAGDSFGLNVDAGTNSSDYAVRIRSRAGTDYFGVRGDGTILYGTAAISTGAADSGGSGFKLLRVPN